MQKLIHGIHHFQRSVFSSQQVLFERLANGQEPDALFITCSDSRINPNLITQTLPGDLFILRNAGNIVPPHGAANGGEGATIEFAVAGLGVKDIIVCGHSLCGAMKGLLAPEQLQDMPVVARWLDHAEATRRIVRSKYASLSESERLMAATEENVLVQLENLRTHPAVAVALSEERLKLHAWMYEIETGRVFAYDPTTEEFEPLVADIPTTPPEPDRLIDSRSI